MSIQPFEIHIPQAKLDDLHERLRRIRWTDEVLDAGWDYGTNLAYMKELTNYWQTQFDWRAQEQRLNRLPHFRTHIDGLGIHFIYVKGKGSHSIPIIISHGWPSSFLEMLKIIPLLSDPASHGGSEEDAFDVIVPSLPGYGFSDRPDKRGMTGARIADLWAHLMTTELGYKHFVAHGGDIGSGVTKQLAILHPDKVPGIHLDGVPYNAAFEKANNLSQVEKDYLEAVKSWEHREGAYAMMQSTKPQTLAYGLNDSPVGLAAWIVEKFRSWSDCAGNIEKRFTRDELLSNITLYWVTETMNSAIRYYYEVTHDYSQPKQIGKITVPTAIAIFPKDICPAPRAWAERGFNVQQWTEMTRGGHFAATEEPELLVEDIRTFFRTMR